MIRSWEVKSPSGIDNSHFAIFCHPNLGREKMEVLKKNTSSLEKCNSQTNKATNTRLVPVKWAVQTLLNATNLSSLYRNILEQHSSKVEHSSQNHHFFVSPKLSNPRQSLKKVFSDETSFYATSTLGDVFTLFHREIVVGLVSFLFFNWIWFFRHSVNSIF